MEGLYFESSATTSFHFLTVSELAAHPSNPVRGLVYGIARRRLRPRCEAPADARRPLLHGVDAGSAGEGRREPGSRGSSRRSPTGRSPTRRAGRSTRSRARDARRRADDRTGRRASRTRARRRSASGSRRRHDGTRDPRARRVGVHGRARGSRTRRCSTRRGRQSGPKDWAARRRRRPRRRARDTRSTRSKVTDIARGRRHDLVPRRQGRHAGRREGRRTSRTGRCTAPTGPYRLAPNLMVVDPDRARRDAHLRPDAVDWLGRFITLRRARRPRRARRCGRARGASGRRRVAAEPRPTTVDADDDDAARPDGPAPDRWRRRSHRHPIGRNRPRRYHDRLPRSPLAGGDRSHRDVSLDAIFKAYDIRGSIPTRSTRRSRAASATRSRTSPARRTILVGHDMRPSSAPLVAAFIEGATLAGADVTDIGLCSTDLVYFASGPLDAPARDVHRQPQPGAVQRHQAVPGRRRAGRRADRARRRSRRWSPRASRHAARSPGKVEHRRPARRVRASTCGRSSTLDVLRPLKVVADTANGMGGLVVPKVFEGLPFDAHGPVRRARRHVPEPPGRPDPGREPEGPPARGRSTAAPTSGSRSTATPTACSSSTTSASRSAVRRRPRSSPRASSTGIPGETVVLQPHLLAGGARGHPRERRHAGAHAGRALVHQAGDGRDRRDLRRRALRALLLPRQLARRLRFDRGAVRARAAVAARTCRSPSCASRSSATRRAARSTRASTIRSR